MIFSLLNPVNVAGALSLLNPFNAFELLEDIGAKAHPSLPQNDAWREQKARKRQLKHAQDKFQWTTNVPSLKGVPLASSVPESDMPTYLWWEKVISVTLTVIENTLAIMDGKDQMRIDALKALQLELEALQKLNSATPGFIANIIDSITKVFMFEGTHFASNFVNRISDVLLQYPVDHFHIEEKGLAAYQALFKEISLTQVQEEFYNDEVFAYYRVGGPNSVLIEKVNALPSNLKVEADTYQSTMKSVANVEDSLAQALAENRIFIVDYKALTYLTQNTGFTDGQPKHLFAPIGLFALAPKTTPAQDKKRQLIPIAIQTDQHGENVVYAQRNKAQNGYWEWQSAKAILQMADGNYHELFVHLARTHLVEEAFKVATERQLARQHPLFLLLTPHFEGTLFINSEAASSLIAEGGPIDQIFAGEISATQYAASQDRLSFDFYEQMLPNDLAKRQLDDPAVLPNYPYRDDALLVWNDIHTWVYEYVHIYYKSNADVLYDTELQAWSEEVMNEGRVAGFKPIKTITQLIDVLTMVIFTASAQHAAVNFPQATMMTYAPAISGSVWGNAPLQAKTEAQWLELFTPITQSWIQQSLLFVLGGVYYRPLGKYVSNHSHKEEWFHDPSITGKGNALSRFQAALAETEQKINKQIAERPAPSHAKYDYLLPSKIPMSINI